VRFEWYQTQCGSGGSGGMKWQWMGGSGRGGSGLLVAGPGVAVDAWQWDEGIDEVSAVRMVPDTVWQWQRWRSCGRMKWQWVGGSGRGGSVIICNVKVAE
jgi:hypothetical protein